MDREPSEGSSNIASVGYDEKTGVMEVEFKGGSIYHYHCAKEVFDDWKAVGFRGKHFHSNIRPVFEGVRQPREQGGIVG